MSHFKNSEAMLNAMREFHGSMSYEADKLFRFYELLNNQTECDEESFKQYRVQVHSMKSTSNLIGATSIGSFAKELEDAAKECNLDFILKQTKDFLKEWGIYKERMDTLFERDSKKHELEAEMVIEMLNNLKDALDDMDVDKMDSIMYAIEEFAFPEDMQKDIENLKALVVELDSDNGAPLIDGLVERLEMQ